MYLTALESDSQLSPGRYSLAPLKSKSLTLNCSGETIIFGDLYLEETVLVIEGATLSVENYSGQNSTLRLKNCTLLASSLTFSGLDVYMSNCLLEITSNEEQNPDCALALNVQYASLHLKKVSCQFSSNARQALLIKAVSSKLWLRKVSTLFQNSLRILPLTYIDSIDSQILVRDCQLYLTSAASLILYKGLESQIGLKEMEIKSFSVLNMENIDFTSSYLDMEQIFVNGQEYICDSEEKEAVRGSYLNYFNSLAYTVEKENSLIVDTSSAPVILELPSRPGEKISVFNPHKGLVVLRDGKSGKEKATHRRNISLSCLNKGWKLVKLPR